MRLKSIYIGICIVCAALLFPAAAVATKTSSTRWETVTITAEGPQSAGQIYVNATKGARGFLKLRVQSAYGDYLFAEEIQDPQLETVTIHRYSESVAGFNDLFYVCLYFGESVAVNFGTEEDPAVEWYHNKALYSFRPTGVEKTILKHAIAGF